MTKVHLKFKKQSSHEPEDNMISNNMASIQKHFCVSNQGNFESRPTYLPTLYPGSICRQFWKAGNYYSDQGAKAPLENRNNYLRIHPEFLHSNATSHKWAFGAIAELLDNAIDEIQNGATFVVIDKIVNPQDGSPALLIQDDGCGMDPEAIRRCMSFGFSDKKQKCVIGQYGNGFKTSSMRLGSDVIVFTRHSNERTLCQSIGLLSYTFLRQTGHDRIVVPLVDYELNELTRNLEPIYIHGKEHFSSNLSTLLQWSPYSAEEMLLKQFEDIGRHGTKIVIYNLWLNDDEDMELDFDFDDEDIRINADAKHIQIGQNPKPVQSQHIADLYQYSLRVYASILYLRLPQNFKIVLRGREVEHHNIASDLKFLEFVLYKPQIGGSMGGAVVTSIGFLKDAPHVNVHGFNIYHKNRLILPFWHVIKDITNRTARGVVGVLEANFIQPTHNKQDFEKTSVFQRLEARLKDMTMEYWELHCGLIGYHQVKKSCPASVPSKGPHSGLQNCLVQSRSLNTNSSATENSRGRRPIPSVDKSSEDPENTLPHMLGTMVTRKETNSAMTSESRKYKKPGACATDAKWNEVEQPSNDNKTQLHDEETSLREENQKLQLRLLALKKREEDLNLKAQQLRHELGEVQQDYARLLAESQLMDII